MSSKIPNNANFALVSVLFALTANWPYVAAHAGTCNATVVGSHICNIPTGVTSITVVAIGGGGGGGQVGRGGAGATVTQTVSLTSGTKQLSLFVGGGGGGGGTYGAGGGGASNVYAGLIIAGGGGGGGNGANSDGGDGNGSSGTGVGSGVGGNNGLGGTSGSGGNRNMGDNGSAGNGGPGGWASGGSIGNYRVGGSGEGMGNGGTGYIGGGGGGGGYGGGGGGYNGGGGGGGGSRGGTVTVAANGGAPNSKGGDGSIVITWTDPVISPPVDPFPLMPNPPTLSVFSYQPTALDLSRNSGPVMTNCLLGSVRTLFGNDAQFLGQNTHGVAKMTQGSNLISFYPLRVTNSMAPSSGINLTEFNTLDMGTSCGTLTVSPALVNVPEFAAVLSNLGLKGKIKWDGNITLEKGAWDQYVARPDYLVTRGTPGTPRLEQGPDGLYRFTDSSGNTQVLHPAIDDTMGIAGHAQKALLLPKVTVKIQTDGTALLDSTNGQRYLLIPDLTTKAPNAFATQDWSQDGPNHYQFIGPSGANSGTQAQGFTVQRR